MPISSSCKDGVSKICPWLLKWSAHLSYILKVLLTNWPLESLVVVDLHPCQVACQKNLWHLKIGASLDLLVLFSTRVYPSAFTCPKGYHTKKTLLWGLGSKIKKIRVSLQRQATAVTEHQVLSGLVFLDLPEIGSVFWSGLPCQQVCPHKTRRDDWSSFSIVCKAYFEWKDFKDPLFFQTFLRRWESFFWCCLSFRPS